MPVRRPDIGFIPTPEAAIDTLLELANMTPSDVMYDLGCGDGRILITAAQRYGIRGVGIDIDLERVQEAKQNAKQADLSDQVIFLEQDLFETDCSEASVVVLYLLPHLNLNLRPQLREQLKPGSRILSVDFDMDDWKPDAIVKLPHIPEESTIYCWRL
jgi:SAM-dependent methyltransferase